MRYLITLCLAAVCSLVPVSAVSGDVSVADVSSSVSLDTVDDPPDSVSSDVDDPPELVDGEEVVVEPDPSEPQTVIVLDPAEIAEYPVVAAAPPVDGQVIDDEPPTTSPFYGSGWVTGVDSRLGTITLYFPRDYCSDTWGLDSNGYLFNITSSTVGGYLSDVYNNSISAPSFSYPRYRSSSSSSWDYVDIHLVPSSSNMAIYTTNRPRVTVDDLFPYVSILLLGGLLVCCMRRLSS